MTDSKTLAELIARGEKDAPAIRAPERETMSFAGLQALCSETVGVLNGAGIGRGDRVAIVLPNSPEMATAFVSIAAGGTAAPLNPAYQAKEFEFYLSDLAAKAVIVLAGGDSPVIEAAGKLNIPLIPLTPDTQGPAGAFTLSPPAGGAMILRLFCIPPAPHRGPRSCRLATPILRPRRAISRPGWS